MDHLAVANKYFDAWNEHDADAIAATFAPSGTYSDPQVSRLDGAATGAYAAGLWDSFPDLSFEVVSAEATSDGSVAAQWVMRGTNRGSFAGLPPTGREVSLPGADFMSFAEDGIAAVQGYFDGGSLPRQLGLNVLVQPTAIGPWSFGTAARVGTGSQALPGAITVTVLEARSDEESEEFRTRSRQIATDLLEAPASSRSSAPRLATACTRLLPGIVQSPRARSSRTQLTGIRCDSCLVLSSAVVERSVCSSPLRPRHSCAATPAEG